MAKVRSEGRDVATNRSPSRRTGWMTGLAVASLAALIVGYWAYRAGADLPGVKLEDQGNAHIQLATEPHVAYNSEPPTSGPHLPYIAPWGIHDVPIARELQVHNLEDGGVMLQYRCAAPCPDLVAKLAEIVRRYDTQVILAPFPGMRTRIALTAWTRLDAFDEFDEARIVRFIRAYRGIDHHKG
ncbi:MAG TPA: DUF3105 domain-containing protein [Methylomirabilota bacterium]